MTELASSAALPEPRDYAGVNWLGLRTLYVKEVRRFLKVGMQTVAAPVVTTLLYMSIFVVATQGGRAAIEGVPYVAFIAPGLVMMAILNNAFANASSSLIQSKIMGTAPDFLTPPLAPFELASGFALGAATRGMFVGLITALAVIPFAGFHMSQPWAVAFYSLGASLMLGMVGVLAGLWAEKFDHLATVTNFVVMPLTFLSGAFYRIDRLPEPFATLSHLNPFFYLIDGLRYGYIGHAEGSLAVGMALTVALNVVLGAACWWIFKTGWRLKS